MCFDLRSSGCLSFRMHVLNHSTIESQKPSKPHSDNLGVYDSQLSLEQAAALPLGLRPSWLQEGATLRSVRTAAGMLLQAPLKRWACKTANVSGAVRQQLSHCWLGDGPSKEISAQWKAAGLGVSLG